MADEENNVREMYGVDRCQKLVDPYYREQIIRFLDSLPEKTYNPAALLRITCEILSVDPTSRLCAFGETSGSVIVLLDERALSRLLDGQAQLPHEARGKVRFIFMRGGRGVAGSYPSVLWKDERWIREWYTFPLEWEGEE